MKKYGMGSLLLLSMISLIGCSDATPECNSDDAKRIVIEIAQDEIKKQLYWFPDMQGGDFEVVNIRTQSHDKAYDLYTCAADLEYTVKDEVSSLPITYTVQNTEDGDGTFYIEVFGL